MARDANAADLADAQLRSLAAGTGARFDDDRMYVHRVASLFEAVMLLPCKTLSALTAAATCCASSARLVSPATSV